MAVLAKILLEEAPRVRELRPDVPEGLDRLIASMVAKEPELRPQDGAELQQWLVDLQAVPSERAPLPPALTASEQRVVSVLVAVLSPPRPSNSPSPMNEVTRAEINPLAAFSSRFGVELHALAEGVAIALAPEELSAADGAALLARFGTFVTESFPGASVALATGSAVTGARVRLPVGDAIDRGVTMVRAANTSTGPRDVQIDEISAALLAARFDVRREEKRLYLQRERLSLDPTRPLLGRPTSCVGRERELTILDATFAECAEGGGPKVVLITAPSGVGKSRLRHEFVRRLASPSVDRVTVLQCQGDPLHVTTPYAQVAQLVRQMASLHEREDFRQVRERMRHHVAEHLPAKDVMRVTDFLGELLGASFDDDEHLALRAARHNETAMADQIRLAFEEIVRAWTKRRPLVLVMEDLHWSDAMSVKVLDGALRKLTGSKLVVLALARPEVHDRFPLLWSNRHITEIRLPPLSAQASSKLVHEVMGDAASDDDVVRIVDRSEGNAFYLEELIRAAVERARRRSSLPPPMQREGLPGTIIAVAQARLERLEPDVRKVLRAASIFGEKFWVEGVCALVGGDPAAVAPILDVLVDHEAVIPSERSRLGGATELSFRHAMLCGAAYATLTDEDRVLGHRLAAEWLGRTEEDREVVALHWLDGNDRARAAEAFADAAESRLSRAQADAAARCAVRSLLVTEEGDQSNPTAVLGRLRVLADGLEIARRIDSRDVVSGLEGHLRLPADAYGSPSTRTIAHLAIERTLESFRSAPASVIATAFSRAACALGALSDFAAAKSLIARAVVMVPDDDASGRALRYASAKVSFWEGEWGEVVENLSTTLLPADTRERVTMLLLLATAVVSVDGREALARGLEYVSRAQALVSASAEDPVALVNCAKARILCFYFSAQPNRTIEAADEALALSRRAGLRYEEGMHLHNQGETYLRIGMPEKARAVLLESNVIAHDLGTEPLRQHNDLILAFLDGEASHLEELADAARSANNLWRELNARYWLARTFANQAHPHARREFGRALALARELKVRILADECALAIAGLPPDRQSQMPPADRPS